MGDFGDEKPLITGQSDDGQPINVEIDIKTGRESVHDSNVRLKTTPERWYILGAFIGLSFAQNCIWNTWGPIAVSAKFVFGWTDSTIALMGNWGPIAFVVSGAFFSWLLSKSLRWSVVLTAFVLVVGAGLRCITSTNPAATWLIHAGQFMNGLGGPVLMGGCPVISALWFPPHQRTTATGLAAGLGVFGYATSFLLGPYIVPDVSDEVIKNCSNSSSPNYKEYNCSETIHHIKTRIMYYMYMDFAVCALLFLMVLIRYPSRPKIPPSLSASIERAPFLPSMKELIKHGQFWMLGITYGLSGGVLGAWGSCLDINISGLHVSEEMAGWLGFSSTMTSQVAVIFVGIFADVFSRKMKGFLVSLFIIGTASFSVFALICSKVIPYNIVALFAVTIVGNIGVFGATPLFFELACESAYPVSEGITNTLMTWLNNLAGLVFLSILMIPSAGKAWMNWCLAGCVAVCIPVIIFYKERYTRLDLDTTKHTHAQHNTSPHEPIITEISQDAY